VAGGRAEAYSGREAELNRRLAGGKEHLYSLHDATHRLHSVGRPVRYWGSAFRVRERSRRARWRLAARIGARRAREGLERPLHLVGVFPYPRSETTLLLDALHRASDVDLDVLYASRAPGAGSIATQPLRHVHWFPRSLRVPLVDRIVGREYPISWTIWRSLRRLRPDCTIIAGPNTFAAEAAVVWCAVRKVPFVLLVDEGEPAPIPDRGAVRRVLRSVVARDAHGVVVPWSAGGRTAAAVAAEDVLRVARSAWRGEDSPAGA
jgi:hypothetical protein